jgi:hypothetical protein
MNKISKLLEDKLYYRLEDKGASKTLVYLAKLADSINSQVNIEDEDFPMEDWKYLKKIIIEIENKVKKFDK